MFGAALVAGGTGLMGLGIAMLLRWLGGKFATDRELWFLQFLSLIAAPILGGAILITFGIRQWM